VLIFHFCSVNKISQNGFDLEDQRGAGRFLEIKKPPDSGKTGNEGIQRVLPKKVWQAGSILLFAEKCPEAFGADERSQTGILTLASDLFPPSRPCGQWHWEL
jgi:hypothetical protein